MELEPSAEELTLVQQKYGFELEDLMDAAQEKTTQFLQLVGPEGANLNNIYGRQVEVGYFPRLLWQNFFNLTIRNMDEFSSRVSPEKNTWKQQVQHDEKVRFLFNAIRASGVEVEENPFILTQEWIERNRYFEGELKTLTTTVNAMNPRIGFDINQFRTGFQPFIGNVGQGDAPGGFLWQDPTKDQSLLMEMDLKTMQRFFYVLSSDLISMVSGNLYGTMRLGNDFIRTGEAGTIISHISSAFLGMNKSLMAIHQRLEGFGITVNEYEQKFSRVQEWSSVFRNEVHLLNEMVNHIPEFNAQEWKNNIELRRKSIADAAQQIPKEWVDLYQFINNILGLVNNLMPSYYRIKMEHQEQLIQLHQLGQEQIRNTQIINELKNESAHFQQQHQLLQTANQQLTNQVGQLQLLINQHATAFQTAATQLDATHQGQLSQALSHYNALKQERDQLLLNLNQLNEQLTHLNTQYNELQNTIIGNNAEKMEQSVVLQNAKIEIQQLQSHINTLQSNIQQNQQEIQQYKQLATSNASSLGALQQQIRAYEASIAVYKTREATWQKQQESYVSRAVNAEEDLASQIKHATDHAEGLDRWLQDFRDAIEVLKKNFPFFFEGYDQSEGNAATQFFNFLNGRMTQMMSQIETLKDADAKVNAFLHVGLLLEENDEVFIMVKNEKRHLVDLIADVVKTEGQLRDTLVSYQTLQEESQNELRTLQSDCDELKRRLQVSDESLQAQLNAAIQKAKTEQTEEVTSLKKRVQELQNDLREADIEFETLEAKNIQLDEKNVALEEKLLEIEEDTKAMKIQLDLLEAKNKTSSATIKEFDAIKEGYEKKLAEQDALLKTSQGKIEMLEKRIIELQTQLEHCSVPSPSSDWWSKYPTCKFKTSSNIGIRLRKGVRCMNPRSLENLKNKRF